MAQIFYTTVPGSPSAQQSFEVDLEQLLQSTVVLNADVQDNSVVVEEGDSFQCGRCLNHFSFVDFIVHKRSVCQGVQFNLTEEETEAILSQPVPLTKEEGNDNIDNNNQQILIDNGELFSFAEEPTQNEALEETLQEINKVEDQSFEEGLQMSDIGNIQIVKEEQNVQIVKGGELNIEPLIGKHFIISNGNKPTEIILAEGNINRFELPSIVSSIANGTEDSENMKLELQHDTVTVTSKESTNTTKSLLTEESCTQSRCPYCGKDFRKRFDLEQHMRSHTGERPFQCVVCGRAFAQKSNVIKHMATHKVWPKKNSTLPHVPFEVNGAGGKLLQKMFACQYCPRVFDNYMDLKSHKKEHISQKVYKCVQKSCPLTFKELDVFLEHTLSHTEKASYECHICHKEFRSLDDLGQHQLFHDGVKSAPKQVSCRKCHSKFMSGESLRKHLVNDSHSYPCPNCDKVFTCERFLRRHIATHSSELRFFCPECHKPFRTEHYLNVHRVIHTSDKPFICQVCSAAFNRRDKLVRHNLTHENAKRYKCPFKSGCNKEFNRKDKLKQHILTHSSWKKYMCRYCSKTFSTVSHVENHEFLCSSAKKTRGLIINKGRDRVNNNNNNVPTIEIVVLPMVKQEELVLENLLLLPDSQPSNNSQPELG